MEYRGQRLGGVKAEERGVDQEIWSIQEVDYEEVEQMVNKISKLKNIALSPCNLNTMVAIEYRHKWRKVPIMIKWKIRKRLVRQIQKLLYTEVQCQSLEKEQKSMYLEGTRKYAKSLKGSLRFLSGSHELGFEGQENRVQTQS